MRQDILTDLGRNHCSSNDVITKEKQERHRTQAKTKLNRWWGFNEQTQIRSDVFEDNQYSDSPTHSGYHAIDITDTITEETEQCEESNETAELSQTEAKKIGDSNQEAKAAKDQGDQQ